MNAWKSLFRRPSLQQCLAGAAIFGASDPNIRKQCAQFDKSKMVATITKAIEPEVNELLETMRQDLVKLREAIFEVDERIAVLESDEAEKRFLTSRFGSMAFADDPAGSLTSIGHKADTPDAPADWIGRAAHIAGKAANERREGTKNQPLNQRLSPGMYRRKTNFE